MQQVIQTEIIIQNWGQQYKFCTYFMKSTILEEAQNVKVRFHVGRGEYVDKDVLAYACSAIDKLLVTNIKVYPSNMEVFTQECCVHLERDTFSAYTEDEEDEVRELLSDKGFISESIDKIIDYMKIYGWFRDEEEEEEED